MKFKTAVLCLTGALCLLFTGCGSTKNVSRMPDGEVLSQVTQSVPVSEEESTAVSDESSEEESLSPVLLESDITNSTIVFKLDDERPYDTLEEYLASDSVKKMISKISGPDEKGILTTSIFAENGDLIFERKFSKDFNLWLENNFIESAKKSVEDSKDVFESLISQLESCINKKTIKVRVRYVDPEGNVLFERVFDNEKLPSAPESSAQTSKQPSAQTSYQTSKEASKETSKQTSKETSKSV